jgi:hypothetical protein
MKIRLILALTFAFALGASAYYTGNKPLGSNPPQGFCCGGDPDTIVIVPPVPAPTPQPGN